MTKPFRIGTRGSDLARWQANHVSQLLQTQVPSLELETVFFTTRGDKVLDKALPEIGGKGLFTEELEQSLREGQIDAAVHSLKDLPTDDPDGLTIGAIPQRAPVEDILVSRDGLTLDALPEGAVIGTSSRRRAAQLLAYRPDFKIIDIRGNVGTRINKVFADEKLYDATILAHAGVSRLELTQYITQIIPFDIMLPAPGQGALGIQCRDEATSIEQLSTINDPETTSAVRAERAFLNTLEGGCSVPVASYAMVSDGQVSLIARVIAVDGSKTIELKGTAAREDAWQLGQELAHSALSQGADVILDGLRT